MKGKIDWAKHNELWEQSSKTIKEYCRDVGISHRSFMSYRYSRPKTKANHEGATDKFSVLDLSPGVRVSTSLSGEFIIYGVSEHQLPSVIRAVHALSE